MGLSSRRTFPPQRRRSWPWLSARLLAPRLTEAPSSAEGWKTIPSWYVVGDADKVIPPALQIKMAERAKAHITHVTGSHPSMIEHPEATVAAIMAADKAGADQDGPLQSKQIGPVPILQRSQGLPFFETSLLAKRGPQ